MLNLNFSSKCFNLSVFCPMDKEVLNINKDILIENLSQESLIGQRIMYDHIKSFDGKLHNFPITREMILSCKMAYQKNSQA